jgi:hypothetical protein
MMANSMDFFPWKCAAILVRHGAAFADPDSIKVSADSAPPRRGAR